MAHCQVFLTSLFLSFSSVALEKHVGTVALEKHVGTVALEKPVGASLRFDRSRTNPLSDRDLLPPLLSPRTNDSKHFKISESRESLDDDVHNRNTNGVKEERGLLNNHRDRSKSYDKRTRQSLDLEGDPILMKIRQSVSGRSHTLIKQLCHMKGRTYICFQHGMSKCVCQGQLADCSGKRFVPNISYIPKLPKDIKCLIFRDNGVKFMDESYFANVSDFKVIDFSYNNLRTISKKTFARFNGGLKYLLLNDNSLSYKNIQNVLNYPPSQRLDLIAAGLTKPIPKNFFRPYSNISTSELYLDLNFLPQFDLNEFSVLKKLRYLSAKNCSIRLLTSAPMEALEFLYLENNPISSFPASCLNMSFTDQLLSASLQTNGVTSMFPKLKELELSNAQVTELLPLRTACLPKLELLDLSLNNISTVRSFSLKNLPSLTVLLLRKMKTNVSTVEKDAFSSESLGSLYLTKNHMQFASPNISDRMFGGHCPFLRVLYMDHNNFSQVPESSFIELFNGLGGLAYLYMGTNRMTFIPSKAFQNLPNVVRLFLYSNEITHIPPKAFDCMMSLRYLHLDKNKISTVSPESFTRDEVKGLVKIDLSKNNFQCNCDLLWFQSWLIQSGGRQFLDNATGYMCADRPGTMVSEFVLSKQACMFSRKTYILFTVLLSIAIVSFIVFVVFYHYRWDIKLALYKRRSEAVSSDRPDHMPDPTHDVFIVYCEDDSPWVVDQLLQRIERDWNLRGYIHERDFEAGRYIMDNIVMAMDRCRHILVVISERFAESKWCDVELQLCQSHIFEHDLPSILVVELEPVELHKMSRIMVALRRSTTFLEWPENPRLEDEFWQRLEQRFRQLRGVCRRGQ